MHFDEALAYLLSLGHETLAIKLGLQKTRLLLESLGNPQSAFCKIQIAGTNGKGSTCAFLDSICRTARIKTGLFTSPHLVSITERIKIDGQSISNEEFAHHVATVRDHSLQLVDDGVIETLPTFFEHITAVALIAFAEADVELAILETGLGGRLDSTTAASAELAVITRIGLDHQEYLGETIEQIAFEKVSIARHGQTVVVAQQQPKVEALIEKHCLSIAARPIFVKENSWRDAKAKDDGRFEAAFEMRDGDFRVTKPGLAGRHQLENAAVAIRAAIELAELGFNTDGAIAEGLANARHPGRLEFLDRCPRLLLDGAHNPDGARALAAYLREFVTVPITFVFGAMRDKEVNEMLGELLRLASSIVVTTFANPRAASAEFLADSAKSISPALEVRISQSSQEAVKLAIAISPVNGLIVVTGSLYLIGEVRGHTLTLSSSTIPET